MWVWVGVGVWVCKCRCVVCGCVGVGVHGAVVQCVRDSPLPFLLLATLLQSAPKSPEQSPLGNCFDYNNTRTWTEGELEYSGTV